MAVTGPWIEGVLASYFAGLTVKAMLVTSAYVQNVDSAALPTAQEVSGTGYTAGGLDVSSLLSVAYDAASNTAVVSCADVDFGTVNLPDVGGIVFYTGTTMIAADVFAPVDVVSANFTYQPGAAGLLTGVITL